MRTCCVACSIALIILGAVGCQDVGTANFQSTGIQGQVYSIATPGPTPVGWIPPPLQQISTILVLNPDRITIIQFQTDSKGTFTIPVPPGTYFLRVKESMIPAETGPYVVRDGEFTAARADFDNGMR